VGAALHQGAERGQVGKRLLLGETLCETLTGAGGGLTGICCPPPQLSQRHQKQEAHMRSRESSQERK